MKDPIGIVVALLFAGCGVSALLFPQWFYRTTSPAQDAKNRRIFRILGFVMLQGGLVLLAGLVFGGWDG